MKLIVGLGNPGPEYERSRHNIGFVVLDHLARKHAPGEVARSRFHAVVIETRFGDEKILLIKPTTFMNRSGLAVSEAIRFYKLDPALDLLILVDDTALPCGKLRLRPDGGTGGHNGLSDITQKLSQDTKGDYPRLRIGIDAPPENIPLKDYVLGKFRPDQWDLVESAALTAADAAYCWATEGTTKTMNRFNPKEKQIGKEPQKHNNPVT